MTNIENKTLLKLFNLILGSFIIGYLLYRRLLVTRLPRDLFFVQQGTWDYRLIFLVIISIIICIIILYHSISFLRNKKQPESMISHLLNKISEIIDNAINEVYGFIVNCIPDVYDKISYFGQKFYKYFKNHSEMVLILFNYLIRITILICFLVDVFVIFRLEYMYRSLYLLFFSLLIKLIIYILKDFASNLPTAQSVLIITDCGINNETKLPITEYELKPEYKDLDLDYHLRQFILCSKISGYLETYYQYLAFFNPRFNIIIYTIYLIGWLFILYKNIMTILIFILSSC